MSDIDYSLEYQFDSDSFRLVFDKSVIVGSIYFDCHSFHIGSRAGSRDICVKKKYICCIDQGIYMIDLSFG